MPAPGSCCCWPAHSRSATPSASDAVWAGIGAVGAATFGSLLLDQPLTLGQIGWLAVIIGGVVWLKLADSPRFAGEQTAAG